MKLRNTFVILKLFQVGKLAFTESTDRFAFGCPRQVSRQRGISFRIRVWNTGFHLLLALRPFADIILVLSFLRIQSIRSLHVVDRLWLLLSLTTRTRKFLRLQIDANFRFGRVNGLALLSKFRITQNGIKLSRGRPLVSALARLLRRTNFLHLNETIFCISIVAKVRRLLVSIV